MGGLGFPLGLLAVLLGLPTSAAEVDFQPLSVWPETSIGAGAYGYGSPLALAEGKALVPGVFRGVPSLLAVEPAEDHPFQVLGSLPMRNIVSILSTGSVAVVVDDGGRLSVVDVTDPSHPRLKGVTLVPDGPVAVSGTHAYVVHTTFSAERPEDPAAVITAVDFGDPTQPRIVGQQPLPVRPARYFSLRAAAAGDDLLCVASISYAEDWSGKFALDVFDIAHPPAPRWVGRHEANAEGVHAVAVVGRRAYWAPWTAPLTGGRQSKLQVVDLSDPASPKLAGTYTTTGEAIRMAVNDRHLYLTKEVFSSDLYRIAVDILDVAEASAPRRVGGFTGTTVDAAPVIAVGGGSAILGSMTSLASYDLSDPTVLRRVAVRNADYGVGDVTLSGDRAFLRSSDTLKIVDIGPPEIPRLLGTYKTANAILIWQVAVAGNYAYLATDSLGVQTLDVSDPALPRRTSVFRGDSQFATVAVDGTLLAAAGYDGLFLLSLADPAKPVLRGSAAVRYPEFREKSVAISGHHVFLTSSDDRDSKTGVMEVFDARDPASPQWVGAYDIPAVARRIAVSGRLAAVASYVPGGDTVFADFLDISDPANPVRLSTHPVIPGGADTATVRLVGPYAILGGPKILDVTDPTQPRQVGELSNLAGHATVSGNLLWAAAYAAGLRSYRVSPATLPRSRTLEVGGPVFSLALRGNVAWAALGSTGLRAVDRSKPDPGALLGSLSLGGKAWDIALAGDHAVVAAGEAGLVTVEVGDPATPRILGELDTPGDARAVAVSGTIACVADFFGGVQVVDVSEPSSPRALSHFAAPGYPLGLAWRGPHVLVACREAGVQVLDLADPTQPKLVGHHLVRGAVETVTVDGDRAFLADGLEGFLVLDVSDPTHPLRLGLAPGDTQARSVAVSGRFAYVADVVRGIRVFDIGDPTHPREVGGTSAVNTYRLAVSGDRLLAAAGSNGWAEFGLFTAPLELHAVAGTTAGTLNLRLNGPAGTPVVVQRSPDLERWQDGPAAMLEASPVTVPVPAASAREFYRLKRP